MNKIKLNAKLNFGFMKVGFLNRMTRWLLKMTNRVHIESIKAYNTNRNTLCEMLKEDYSEDYKKHLKEISEIEL